MQCTNACHAGGTCFVDMLYTLQGCLEAAPVQSLCFGGGATFEVVQCGMELLCQDLQDILVTVLLCLHAALAMRPSIPNIWATAALFQTLLD